MSQISLANARAPFVLVLDLGTSSLRAMVYDANARAVEGYIARYPIHAQTNDDGASTLEPRVVFDAFCSVLDEITRNIHFPIAAVAASSLAYNVFGLDAQEKPLTPAYLYSDTQNVRAVAQLRVAYDWAPMSARTGCPLHTSYLPARFLWLRETQSENFARVTRWVSLYEFILLRVTGHAMVSHSFAAWSGMLNHATLDWDDDVLRIAGIARETLTTPRSAYDGACDLLPEYAARWNALAKSVWLPALGDGALANVGSGCVDETRVAVTIGTSGAMRVVMPLQKATAALPRGLWMYRVDERDGLLGGSLNNGGNVFAYFAKTFQLPPQAEMERPLQAMAPDAHGLTMLPFFAGERSPGYRGDARAAIHGWSLSTTPIELWRAALEAIAYRFAAIYDLLRVAILSPRELIASGAALQQSRVWVQILADVLGIPVSVSGEEEASARGAALIALRALHVIDSFDTLPAAAGQTYLPNPAHFERYHRARERQERMYALLLES